MKISYQVLNNMIKNSLHNTPTTVHNSSYAVNGLCTGVGLYWATYNENYSHFPLCILFPCPYVGYQTFKNKDKIINMLK